MLGDIGCGAGSRWCSEVWRCSPKVAPDTAPPKTQMADCDQCGARFTLLRRKKICGICGLVFCGECLKRVSSGGSRRCNKCLVLTQWPLDISEVTALRVKDLRHFLHSRHIDTATCTEKRDLIDLVTRHISSQHRVGARSQAGPRHTPPTTQWQGNESKPHLPTTTTTRDDGIRVRPTSRDSGSIRVRPVDSIRVTPGRPTSPEDSPDYDPEEDLGIRVFASEAHGTRNQETQADRSEDEHTVSCCSLDSCLNTQSPTSPGSGVDNMAFILPSEETEAMDSHSQATERDTGREGVDDGATGDGEAELEPPDNATSFANTAIPSNTTPSAPPLLEEDEHLESSSASGSSSPSPSSSTQPSTTSSPEPVKAAGEGGILSQIVDLANLKSEEDIQALSVRQCKELLALHRVTYVGVREKSELIAKIKILWKDYQNTKKEMESLPEELVCKICMDSAIDCVLLECGHMVACTSCGKQMSECPVCRQYVVRVVRTFRA